MRRAIAGRSGRTKVACAAALIAAVAAWSARADDDAPAIVQEYSLGAARLTLEAGPREVAIDGRVGLTLELALPADRAAALPDLPDRLGRFAVVAQDPAEITAQDDGLILRRHYELEPEGVGALSVPSLAIAVRSRGAGGDAVEEIRTDTVPITVISVVPEGVDYAEPKDIAPPMALPRPGWARYLWALAAVAAAALVAVLVWRRLRRPARAVRPQSAHRVALAELERLEQELEGETGIDVFYVRLSAILRRYLDWRFGLRAPMQTTEEFLATLPAAEGALVPYRSVLGSLLASFDLVKFARLRPERADMDAALRSVRAFVERTGDDAVLIDPGAAPGSCQPEGRSTVHRNGWLPTARGERGTVHRPGSVPFSV